MVSGRNAGITACLTLFLLLSDESSDLGFILLVSGHALPDQLAVDDAALRSSPEQALGILQGRSGDAAQLRHRCKVERSNISPGIVYKTKEDKL